MEGFNWYRLFNLDDFEDTGLPSYEFTVELTGIGVKEVLITKGNSTSITYGDTMLTINLNNKNPFRYGERAVFLDDNSDVWLGIYHAS
jgi:hypothetical protein